MEFRKAKEILEEEAKPIQKQLITLYRQRPEDEVQDPSKDLEDTRYSFEYRKKYALYLKKFAFYDQSQEILTQILKEEIAYYKLASLEAGEGELQVIDVDGVTTEAANEYYILKPNALPYNQVRNTYFAIGKIAIFKLKVAQAVQCLSLASDIATKASGEENTLYVANCHRYMKEAYLKSYS